MFGELKSSLPSEELSVETPSTPDLQSVVYVTRANDERIFLDTLPLPARDIVYGHLANRGHFEALANLRKTNKACKDSVDAFFTEKKNIPPIEAIVVTEMEYFGLEIELQMDEATLPLRPNLAKLKDNIDKIKIQSFVASFTVSVRDRTDPVVSYISEVVSPHVRVLHLPNLRSADALFFIKQELLGKTTIREIKVYPENVAAGYRFREALFSMITSHKIREIEYSALMDTEDELPDFDPRKDLI